MSYWEYIQIIFKLLNILHRNHQKYCCCWSCVCGSQKFWFIIQSQINKLKLDSICWVILFSSFRPRRPFEEVYWWIVENWANVKSEKTDKTNLPLTNRLCWDKGPAGLILQLPLKSELLNCGPLRHKKKSCFYIF